MLRLQRQAGNAAVSRMIQRKPLDAVDDPKGYTAEKGVTFQAEGVIRREVRGLKYGVTGGFRGKYATKKHPEGQASAERAMTRESPDNMAVVIMPDRPLDNVPVQVVLHFHGFGWRPGTDPYAGYLVATGAGGQAGIGKGTVRDVDQERWEQQTGAVGKERAAAAGQPAIVAILAQGRGKSDFGDLPTFDYVQDVFSKVSELSKVKDFSIVQTAHSGGGYKLAENLGKGEAGTADRGALPAAKPGHAAQAPADMVVMFDAEAIGDVTKWAIGHVTGLAAKISAAVAADKPADAQAAIKASPKLRAYFAEGKGYADAYAKQNEKLAAAIDKVPAPWGWPTSGAVTVADLFRFVPVAGVTHEFVISKGKGGDDKDGAVADALRASTDPTGDRATALPRKAAKSKAKPPVPAKATVPADGKAPAGAQVKPVKKADAGSTGVGDQLAAGATAASATAASAKVAAAPRGWTASDAASAYRLDQQQRDDLAAQTPEQRAADAKELKSKKARFKELTKAEKKAVKAKTELPESDAKELAELRDLQKKVAATSMALKQSDVEDILRAAGHTVDEWYGDVQQGTFLNVKVRVHKNMAEALQRAEATLVADPKTNPDQLDAVALGKKLTMSPRASDMRIPKAAVGGTSISMHTFGLAVDLNYAGNPYLALNGRTAPNVILRASSLVDNAPVDVGTSLGDTKQAYDKLTGASRALVTYLSFKDPANRQALRDAIAAHTATKGEPVDEAGWVAQIEKDHKAIVGSADFAGHTSPEQGFVDFKEAVVMALAGAGLTWGGTYDSTKDLMHFDLRSGEGAKIHKARVKHKSNK